MPMLKDELERRLKAAFPHGILTIQDLAGDNDHYAVRVVDAAFARKPRVAQHRMVMEAVTRDGGDVHALSIKTDVPE